MAKYWSLAVEGVPLIAQRYASESHCRDGAHKTLAAHPDIERLEILEINTRSHGYVTQPPKGLLDLQDSFKGIVL